jgi:hypothetical protein
VPAAPRSEEHQAPQRPRTARQAARLLRLAHDQRTSGEHTRLTRRLAADPEIATTSELIQAFGALVRERRGVEVAPGIAPVQPHGPEQVRARAHGRLTEEAAVRAGLPLPWSMRANRGPSHAPHAAQALPLQPGAV